MTKLTKLQTGGRRTNRFEGMLTVAAATALAALLGACSGDVAVEGTGGDEGTETVDPALVAAVRGVVALGLYLCALERSPEELEKLITVFTDANVEFSGTVKPGDRVTTTGKKTFFRRLKLRSEVEMRLDDGTVVCSGVLSGMGVPR